MAASIYFTGVMILLNLSVIISDPLGAPSCSQYLNQSYLQSLTPEIQKKICDNLLRDLSPVTGPEQTRNNNKPSQYEVWGYGVMMVTFISLTSVVGVGVMPLMSRTFYSNLLTALIGLAVGSLAGSAVFHLIPSAFRKY